LQANLPNETNIPTYTPFDYYYLRDTADGLQRRSPAVDAHATDDGFGEDVVWTDAGRLNESEG